MNGSALYLDLFQNTDATRWRADANRGVNAVEHNFSNLLVHSSIVQSFTPSPTAIMPPVLKVLAILSRTVQSVHPPGSHYEIEKVCELQLAEVFLNLSKNFKLHYPSNSTSICYQYVGPKIDNQLTRQVLIIGYRQDLVSQ